MWQTLQDRMDRLTAGQLLTRDDIIWWALVVGLLFATVHLVTMLVTRWGDRKISFKSLVASILVHMTCGLGVVVMEPLPPVGSAEGLDDETEFLQEVQVEASQDREMADSGELPFWEQPLETRMEQTRLEAIEQSEPSVEDASRNSPQDSPKFNVEPDLMVEVPDEQPDLEQTPDQQLTSKADTSLTVEEPLPFDTALKASSVPRERLDPLRPGARTDLVERDQPRRGAIERVDKDLDIDSTLRNLDSPSDIEAESPEGVAADDYESRSGPVAVDLPADEAGGVSGDENGVVVGAARLNPRINRLDTRPRDGSTTGQSTRSERESRPNTPLVRPSAIPSPVVSASTPGLPDGPRPNAISSEAMAPVTREKGSVAPIYQLRDLANRKQNALRYGGTEASERAVEASLRWLARAQDSAGFWDASRHGAR